MKTQLIILSEQTIIISDENIETLKKGDTYYDGEGNFRTWGTGNMYSLSSKKILAGIPELPSIDYNNLEEQFGIVDVEKLAENYARKQCEDLYSKIGIAGHSWGWETAFDFKEGFKAAQQLNDKKFSEGDMYNSFVEGVRSMRLQAHRDGNEFDSFDDFFESLSKPKVFDIEIEMMLQVRHGIEWHDLPNQEYGNDPEGIYQKVPKITNNQIKIIKVL
jgi:hypothetical protein